MARNSSLGSELNLFFILRPANAFRSCSRMTRKITPTGPGFSDLSTCDPVIPSVGDLSKYRDWRDKAAPFAAQYRRSRFPSRQLTVTKVKFAQRCPRE